MKTHNEYLLLGGKKYLYSHVDIDGVKIYHEQWYGRRGREAIRKIARTFTELEKAEGLLAMCQEHLSDHSASLDIKLENMVIRFLGRKK